MYRIREWLEGHMTIVTVSMGVLLVLAGGIWLFIAAGKSKDRNKRCV